MDRKVVNSHFEKGYLYLVFDDGSVVWVSPPTGKHGTTLTSLDVSTILDGDTEPEDFVGP